MDPFTQRMLERAKVRREKLDSHKMELQQTTILQENSNISHKRKPLEVFSGKNTLTDSSTDRECLSKARKSKLQKLAQFYSGESENISFEDVENRDDACEIDEPKQPLKLERLTQLASKIREWDDGDAVKKSTNIEKPAKKESEVTKKIPEKNSWDPSLVKNLCSQGFTLKENESKLVYNFPKPQTGNEVSKPKAKNLNSTEVSSRSGGCGDSKENESKVLRKAAFFEGCAKEETNLCKLVKDPTELSVAERKALFEKNLSEAIFPSNNFYKSVPQKSNLDHHKVPVDVKDKIREANSLSTEKVQFEREKTENNCSTRFKGKEEEYKQNKIIVPDSPEVVPAPPPMPSFQNGVEDGFATEERNLSANAHDSTGGTGRLYPSLSNLDVTEVNDSTLSELESTNDSKNSNFYLNMTLSDLMEINKNNPCTPPSENSFSKSKECQVLNKMNKLLENALNELSSEEDEDTESEKVFKSPPNMIKSSSFEYKGNNEERNENNLLHTVSFYRKQQSSVHSPNHGTQEKEEESGAEYEGNESVLVQEKIEELLVEVSKQQTIISQASQALNLCLSTVEFSGSEEQVEGERLLLLATHKRQACLNEIQRLKVENSLRSQEGKLLTEKGDVNLSNISIKLKRDAIRALVAAENHLYFVCLIKSDEQVLATPVVSVLKENLKDLILQFPGQVKLESLLSNFKITVEVYSLELNKECLPHNVKYHIASKKEKKLLTPIKSKKSESKLVKPYIQSPAGPNAVRTSNFQMCGYIVFSLKEITRTQWTLNKVPYISPLEGTLSMSIKSQLRLEDEFRGFLTMFDDISGFGAWHRRWCLLSSHFISYWKYPDDEQKKVPIGTIDLKSVITENVGLVSRDVCARLNTFLLESTRTRLSDDKNSLVLNVNGNTTTIRHLLSADSKQEMLTWCRKLNTTLALLRSWKCNNKE